MELYRRLKGKTKTKLREDIIAISSRVRRALKDLHEKHILNKDMVEWKTFDIYVNIIRIDEDSVYDMKWYIGDADYNTKEIFKHTIAYEDSLTEVVDIFCHGLTIQRRLFQRRSLSGLQKPVQYK
jgi:hypothetical protein